MKERPILFSAPMVLAIIAGTKTQTRRICKEHVVEGATATGCKYGVPGDRLWVKETHIPKASGTIYRADFDQIEAAGLSGMYGGWKPSIFCKRSDSRITLEIVSVRIERLQSISESDAKAEGVEQSKLVEMKDGSPCYSLPYQILWSAINGEGSWDANPWVWVIEFKKL